MRISQRRISQEKSASSLESSAGLGGMSVRLVGPAGAGRGGSRGGWRRYRKGTWILESKELPHAFHPGPCAAPFLPSEKTGTTQAGDVRAHENAWHMVAVHYVLICFLPWHSETCKASFSDSSSHLKEGVIAGVDWVLQVVQQTSCHCNSANYSINTLSL